MTQVQELAVSGRMLTSKEVMAMLNVSNVWLWRHSNAKSEAHRIPSYKLGGKRLYKYEEIIHYLDNHKAIPNK
jgi:predicted DNA-binding transcriptional regulator AlpA